MRDYTQPTWGFTYNDGEGNITTKSFSTKSETWIEALSRFLDFTRGVGYTVANNAVALNADIEVDECAWGGNYYISEGEDTEDDWKHPNDFDPSFEGCPNDCAFKHETTLKDLKESVDALTLEISALNCYKEKELQHQGAAEIAPCSLEEFLRAITKVKGEQD